MTEFREVEPGQSEPGQSEPTDPGPPDYEPPRPDLRYPSGLWGRFILRFSHWYAALVLGRGIGPGLGIVSTDLTDDNLRNAVPGADPPPEMLDAVRDTIYDSNPSEILGRANRWSAALQFELISGQLRVPARTVLTTYGMVAFKDGIRLSVIHYLEPRAIFRLRRRPQATKINHNEFPVVVRPAAFKPMSAQTTSSSTSLLRGNIWLKTKYRNSSRLGYLTANHAVKGAKRGTIFTPTTHRSPPPGIVTLRSKMMDSAVVRTDLDPGLRFRAVRPAPIIGYKPVRLITERNEIVANVIEHTGQLLGTIPVSKAPEEPLTPVLVLLNRFLEEGDSGCLIVDCEHEQPDGGRATPYAMYLGALNLNIGRAGYGQLLEQTRLHWGLEFCEPWEDDDERKPRIGY